ncbi:SMC family ATPase [Marinilabiliaceae bacterium JC040]|nr:SMC family ATPase [Marinilabiliaceae bacterium JC040]
MKPIKLVIEGLYSYQERQEIDFEKLLANHIFGVFGHVGSGKSSILEAITYALYGEIDKMNKREERLYNMMNLKSNTMLIDFTLEIDGIRYKSETKARRNSKKFHDVKLLGRQLYKEEGGEYIPINQADFVDAIGLSYENFKRTIIIPQGKFKEFLELKETDRVQMLKEIFNLEKFDLANKVKPLYDECSENIHILEGKIDVLGNISKEELKEKKVKNNQLQIKVKNVNDNLLKSEKEEKLYAEIQNLFKRQKEFIKTYESLKREEKTYAEKKDILERFENCDKIFRSDYIEYTRLDKSIKDKTNESKISSLEIKNLNKDLEERKQIFIQIEKDFKNNEKRNLDLEDLRIIKEIIELNKENVSLSENLKKLEEELSIIDKKNIIAEDFIAEKTKLIENLKSNTPDILILNKVKDWYSNYESIIKEQSLSEKNKNNIIKNKENDLKNSLQDIQSIINKLKEEIKDAEGDRELEYSRSTAELNTNFENLLIEIEQTDYSLLNGGEENRENLKTKIEESLNSIRNISKLLNEIENKYKVEKKLEDYAEDLKNGEACPLCGSKDHPKIMDVQEISNYIESCEILNTKCKYSQDAIFEIKNTANGIISLLNRNDKELQKEDHELKDIASRIEKHKSNFQWSEYSNKKKLELALKKYEEERGKINKEEKTLQAAREKYQKLQKEKKEKDEARSKGKEVVDKNTSQLSTLKQILKNLKIEDYEKKSIEEIDREGKDLNKKIEKTTEEYNRYTKEIQKTESEIIKISSRLSLLEQQIKEEEKSYNRVKEDIEEKISKSNFNTLSEVKEELNKKIDAKGIKESIEKYNNDCLKVKTSLEEIEKLLDNREYDEEKHKELQTEIKEKQKERDILNTSIGSLSKEIEEEEKSLKQQEDYLKEKKKLELRLEDLKVLRSLFKQQGFVKYVSTVYLQNLCNAANSRFHLLTGQKLSLELNDKNDFIIRDFINGGKTRSVKTLSGGQSFQVSLSLALALTDSIHKYMNTKQNFFFLDEGFGSLDKEALSVVFDTLKSLQKENRIIGIISHVEELQQELSVYINVENDEERGSLISYSWE